PTGAISDDWKDNGDFDVSQWTYVTGGPGGVGYERSSGYEDYFTLDVEAEMYNAHNSCFVRIPFVFRGDATAYDTLTLKVRYDDGFVAYINGDENEVARRNFDGTANWDSGASQTHSDSVAVELERMDISDYRGTIVPGNNVLAVHAMNHINNQSDFLISVELEIGRGGGGSGGDVSDSAIEYSGPMTFSRSTQVRSRVKSDTTWSALNEATYAVGPVAESLRISEIMYHPQESGDPNDPNEEFIELTNVGGESINLSLASLTNGIEFTFGDVELGVGDYVVIVRDESAFAAAHPEFSGVIAGQYGGSLNNGGERIELKDAMRQTILDFSYKDGWRNITDGGGYSLTIIDASNPDPNSWDCKDSWRASAYAGGSPGWDDSGVVPNPGAVVISEIMAHSHGDAPDWIELYNTTAAQIDIGGWYLSDSESNLKKYRFADGAKIDAYSYVLLYEDVNFGDGSSDPGRIAGFGFSENGEAAYLTSAEADLLTGYREVESFGSSYTGISFGRYHKLSTGNYNFVATDHNTPGRANAYPKVGPIVINEIMYNPDWPAAGLYGNDRYEYVELKNITGAPVSLWREDKLLPWKFSQGIDYVFPDWPNDATIPASDYIVVVRDVNAFTERYPSVPGEKIFGPYEGQLSDGGEELEISMPGDKDKFGRQHYIRIDRVTYSDGSHDEDVPGGVDLWPADADGGGDSLNRIAPQLYGNDPNNWTNAAPSPGI
ncbi:MAG: lamin tail domain-containing protein, partial [Sedimentisphaerales bacterium]|nr:lamin tail domain-containing protein [Sedimentisphaerales bacterium]